VGVGPFVRRRRAARGGACAVVEVPSVSCERYLALGQRRAGAERVNPLPDAVPSSRPLRTPSPRARSCDAVGRRARARWEAWTRSFSVIGLVRLWWCEASCICAWSSTRVVGVP
jgi:hypothetical protein